MASMSLPLAIHSRLGYHWLSLNSQITGLVVPLRAGLPWGVGSLRFLRAMGFTVPPADRLLTDDVIQEGPSGYVASIWRARWS